MESYAKRTWWAKHRLTERLKEDSFLEAAINGAFVIAAADGNASEQEYDALLDRLEILGGVDRETIDNQFTIVSNELEANGFEPRIARAAELVDGEGSAEAVLMLAIAVALADDDVSTEEREVIGQLATGLGLGDIKIDPLIEEIRG
ncbi:MAG TPA: tellurite resistance TerB family protein [Kofleriaceae bacterium]|jgi:tellurite resistance protein